MPKDFREYLKHILDECIYISSVLETGITKDEFFKNETLKRAVVRSLEIIGEASKKIPVDQKVKWDNITWKHMAGMRDRLIHDYMGINYIIVWDVITNKLPVLNQQIIALLDQTDQIQDN